MDAFKRVNDEHGHEAGDQVLRLFGEILRGRVRLSDLPARLGGDEFAVLLRNTNRGSAGGIIEPLASQLRSALSRLSFPVRFSMGLPVSIRRRLLRIT